MVPFVSIMLLLALVQIAAFWVSIKSDKPLEEPSLVVILMMALGVGIQLTLCCSMLFYLIVLKGQLT